MEILDDRKFKIGELMNHYKFLPDLLDAVVRLGDRELEYKLEQAVTKVLIDSNLNMEKLVNVTVNQIDYAIVNCGYVHRLIEKTYKLEDWEWNIETTIEKWGESIPANQFFTTRDALFLYDSLDSDEVYYMDEKYKGKYDELVNITKKDANGSIVFKVSDWGDAFNKMGDLSRLEHCGFFDLANCTPISRYRLFDGKIAHIIFFNTESG